MGETSDLSDSKVKRPLFSLSLFLFCFEGAMRNPCQNNLSIFRIHDGLEKLSI